MAEPAEPEPEALLHDGATPDMTAGVRRQAHSIMEHVLQTAPPNQREQLRSYQQAFAGRPELALAEFLRAVRPKISDYNDNGT